MSRNLVPYVTLLIGIGLIAVSHMAPRSPADDEFRFVPPPPHIDRFVFGYRDTAADILWVRLLQDIHVCESVKGGIAHVEGQTRKGAACHKGWVYQMVEAITTLTPQWKLPFRVGATLLSIVVDDIDGATLIFEKALKLYPDDYSITYAAAYHYLWELDQKEKAAELLIRAAQRGGPVWFYSLAGKLYTQAGRAEIAKNVIEDALARPQSKEIEDRLKMRLEEAKKSMSDGK